MNRNCDCNVKTSCICVLVAGYVLIVMNVTVWCKCIMITVCACFLPSFFKRTKSCKGAIVIALLPPPTLKIQSRNMIQVIRSWKRFLFWVENPLFATFPEMRSCESWLIFVTFKTHALHYTGWIQYSVQRTKSILIISTLITTEKKHSCIPQPGEKRILRPQFFLSKQNWTKITEYKILKYLKNCWN